MPKIGEDFVRKLDNRGRITIGADMLKDAEIPKDSILKLETEKGKIVISVLYTKRGE